MKGSLLTTKRSLLALTIASFASTPALAQDDSAEAAAPAAASFGEALSMGEVSLGLRSRHETVEVDGADDADLLSLKTRLTYTSAPYAGLSLLVEVDDVTHLTEYEGGVADWEGTEVNQAYLAYSTGATTFKYGRQRILLDNQRFVGGVGFRQNEQTYDGFSVTNTSLSDTTLFLAHVDNVNRIFGEDDPRGDNESDTYLLNAKYTGFSAGTLSTYAYLIDNLDVAAFSSDTFGVRFAGAKDAFNYAFEYATQSDAGDNPASYTADYLLTEGGLKAGAFTFKVGYEVLGADGADGQFTTPLATLHKFQGWSDKFLGGGTGNIAGGIEDLYVVTGTSAGPVKFTLAYHQLTSDDPSVSGMDELGSEVGFSVGGKVAGVGLSLKYAEYLADEFSVDTSKLWLTAQTTF